MGLEITDEIQKLDGYFKERSSQDYFLPMTADHFEYFRTVANFYQKSDIWKKFNIDTPAFIANPYILGGLEDTELGHFSGVCRLKYEGFTYPSPTPPEGFRLPKYAWTGWYVALNIFRQGRPGEYSGRTNWGFYSQFETIISRMILGLLPIELYQKGGKKSPLNDLLLSKWNDKIYSYKSEQNPCYLIDIENFQNGLQTGHSPGLDKLSLAIDVFDIPQVLEEIFKEFYEMYGYMPISSRS